MFVYLYTWWSCPGSHLGPAATGTGHSHPGIAGAPVRIPRDHGKTRRAAHVETQGPPSSKNPWGETISPISSSINLQRFPWILIGVLPQQIHGSRVSFLRPF